MRHIIKVGELYVSDIGISAYDSTLNTVKLSRAKKLAWQFEPRFLEYAESIAKEIGGEVKEVAE